METCDYCDATFDDEDALIEHLADEHRGDLGPIDERRVSSHVDDGTGLPTGPAILGGVIVAGVLLVAFVVFAMGSGGSTDLNGIDVTETPGAAGSAHEHGTINVTVDGEQLDFSQSQYQYQDNGEYSTNKFHFEGGVGDVWHAHAEGITLEYAMATLGIEVERNAVVVNGETYTDSGDTEVVVEVNGQSVDPASYVLDGTASAGGQQGDHIRIVVRTDG